MAWCHEYMLQASCGLTRYKAVSNAGRCTEESDILALAYHRDSMQTLA